MGNSEVILLSVMFGTTLFIIYCIYCALDDIIRAKRRRLNAKQKTNEETDRKI